MSDEDAFRRALDANPADHAMRLVYADWLEERGDWRAKGYRWMGTNRKRPSAPNPEWQPDPTQWAWWGIGDHDPESVIGTDRKWKDIATGGVSFPTLQAAEEALCKALEDR